MGRAEKRMAKKREANGPQYQGGRPLTLNTNRNDRVPRNTVLSRLREVPVFGIRVLEGSNAPKTEGGFLVPAASDGLVSTFYMDPREAERVVQGTGAARELRVVGITLDEIVFDTSVRLQPAESAVNEGLTIPKDRALVTVIATPLFCIDGLQTTDKDTQVSSLPLFFSKADLLQFANPVYGASEAAKKVLITDLQVVAPHGPFDDKDGDDGRETTQRSNASDLVLNGPRYIVEAVFHVLNHIIFQTALYIAFVIVFLQITESLRLKEEFHFDRHIAETFIENQYDSSQNTFNTIVTVADIYEWGNNVLISGLFSNLGPCSTTVGAVSFFRSWGDESTSTDLSAALAAKGCNDNTWADGDVVQNGAGTPLTPEEIASTFDVLDWTEGLVFKQTRVRPMNASECFSAIYSESCIPELQGYHKGHADTAPFGFNWTHPGEPLRHPWRHHSAEWLGANPSGVSSAAVASYRLFPSSGYVAIVIPFLSATLLPEQRGTADGVLDFRAFRLNRSSTREVGAPRPSELYFCVRLSWNGEHLHQLCDPNDAATGRTLGVVRAAVEEFFNDLKRAHFIDKQTRALSITMPLRSNFLAVRSRVTLLFETTATGTVIPSYDMETSVESSEKMQQTAFWLTIGLVMNSFFCGLEALEMLRMGVGHYFTDPWNVMDWANFGLFFLTYFSLLRCAELRSAARGECHSEVCVRVGYRDDWELMDTMRTSKLFLSLCVCIQLLKIIKFMRVLIPKTALATAVLYHGAVDLFFFGLVFAITLFSFSMMFYVQLGPVMEDFADQTNSFFSLARALFGDFDVDDILDNSSGYLNLGLFLFYLFVAIFIMLSMFLAILGESQSYVRGEMDKQRRRGEMPPEYGIFSYAYEFVVGACGRVHDCCHPRRSRTGPKHGPGIELPSAAAADDGGSGSGSDGDVPPAAPTVPPVATGHIPAPSGGPTRVSPRMTLAPRAVAQGSAAPVASYGQMTPRTETHFSIRTELADLREELASMSARQKKIHLELKALAPKNLAQLIYKCMQEQPGAFTGAFTATSPAKAVGIIHEYRAPPGVSFDAAAEQAGRAREKERELRPTLREVDRITKLPSQFV
ncbi:polycystic kidney disease 2-like 1 [Chrysochromulina tobinii]|uniref:Polycystic kidney disease 2-like 1 n=1 Tax=Chrysochromulina tobinii TaxID=1460289 RepID=A0A0M0K1U3_9EUKA|nr:polycystic kidney disease 2-like 1 [Chrysochromulina tobinii]|eukprot:KOO32780.1 polycystic kidney disease 2-like 1 [Chrysochromulina sp. CCMP291]